MLERPSPGSLSKFCTLSCQTNYIWNIFAGTAAGLRFKDVPALCCLAIVEPSPVDQTDQFDESHEFRLTPDSCLGEDMVQVRSHGR